MKCACGCGVEINPTDKHGRPHRFVNGHNQRVKCNLKNRGRNQKPEIGDDMIHKRYPIDARCPQCGKDYVAKLTVPWTGGNIKPRITCDDCEYKRYIWQRAESRKHDRYNRKEGRMHTTCSECDTILYARTLKSAGGYYIGYQCPKCGPYQRLSFYYDTAYAAEQAHEEGTA